MSVSYVIKSPKFRTAKQLGADGTFPVSEKMLVDLARKYGIGREAGRSYLFSNEHIVNLYEALPCHSNSSAAQKLQTGSCVELSGDKALKKVLGLLT